MINRTLLAALAILVSQSAFAGAGTAQDLLTGRIVPILNVIDGKMIIYPPTGPQIPTPVEPGSLKILTPFTPHTANEVANRIQSADAGKAAKGELTGDWRDQDAGLGTRQDFQGLQKPIN